jgi:ubiquinone/menaquinone biosynthesis C-methylase UbiE
VLKEDARAVVARQEKLFSTPQAVDQRRRLRAILSARPGEFGLDVGCGVAHLACELAVEVAPGGRISAIDSRGESVEASKVRVGEAGLTDLVDVRPGDAADLPFPDGVFDFVVASQVYCYVPDVGRAVREAARVLRKGGRLVVLDSDWDMCVWASKDPVVTRRVIAARAAAQYAHPHLPRDLHALFRAAGMTITDAQSFALLEIRYDPDSFSVGSIPLTRDAALTHGVPAEEVGRWEDELRSRTSEGEWFFCLNRFVFTATK